MEWQLITPDVIEYDGAVYPVLPLTERYVWQLEEAVRESIRTEWNYGEGDPEEVFNATVSVEVLEDAGIPVPEPIGTPPTLEDEDEDDGELEPDYGGEPDPPATLHGQIVTGVTADYTSPEVARTIERCQFIFQELRLQDVAFEEHQQVIIAALFGRSEAAVHEIWERYCADYEGAPGYDSFKEFLHANYFESVAGNAREYVIGQFCSFYTATGRTTSRSMYERISAAISTDMAVDRVVSLWRIAHWHFDAVFDVTDFLRLFAEYSNARLTDIKAYDLALTLLNTRRVCLGHPVLAAIPRQRVFAFIDVIQPAIDELRNVWGDLVTDAGRYNFIGVHELREKLEELPHRAGQAEPARRIAQRDMRDVASLTGSFDRFAEARDLAPLTDQQRNTIFEQCAGLSAVQLRYIWTLFEYFVEERIGTQADASAFCTWVTAHRGLSEEAFEAYTRILQLLLPCYRGRAAWHGPFLANLLPYRDLAVDIGGDWITPGWQALERHHAQEGYIPTASDLRGYYDRYVHGVTQGPDDTPQPDTVAFPPTPRNLDIQTVTDLFERFNSMARGSAVAELREEQCVSLRVWCAAFSADKLDWLWTLYMYIECSATESVDAEHFEQFFYIHGALADHELPIYAVLLNKLLNRFCELQRTLTLPELPEYVRVVQETEGIWTGDAWDSLMARTNEPAYVPSAAELWDWYQNEWPPRDPQPEEAPAAAEVGGEENPIYFQHGNTDWQRMPPMRWVINGPNRNGDGFTRNTTGNRVDGFQTAVLGPEYTPYGIDFSAHAQAQPFDAGEAVLDAAAYATAQQLIRSLREQMLQRLTEYIEPELRMKCWAVRSGNTTTLYPPTFQEGEWDAHTLRDQTEPLVVKRIYGLWSSQPTDVGDILVHRGFGQHYYSGVGVGRIDNGPLMWFRIIPYDVTQPISITEVAHSLAEANLETLINLWPWIDQMKEAIHNG